MILGGLVAVLSCAATVNANAAPIGGDTCRYTVHVPRDLDMPGTTSFDTLITRTGGCAVQLLHLPQQGMSTEYMIYSTDTVKASRTTKSWSVHYFGDEAKNDWLDISAMPSGTYIVHLMACGNAGEFTLRIGGASGPDPIAGF